jgi:transaldolase
VEQFTLAGVNLDELASTLQHDGADAFAKSWDELLSCISEKSARLKNVD